MDLATAFQTARRLHEQACYGEAESWCRKVLAVAPRHFDCLHLLGKLKLQTGEPREAVRALTEAAGIRPGSAAVHVNLGTAFRQTGDFDSSLTEYDRALQLNPRSVAALNNRGEVLILSGRYGDALASLEQALLLKPMLGAAWNNRGRALVPLFRYGDAIESYDRAIRLDPDNDWPRLCRGEAHWLAGDCEAAVADFQQALTLNPENIAARWAAVMAAIPVVPMTADEVPRSRRNFVRELSALAAYLDSGGKNGASAVGASQPFYLAYQEENNRELLAQYGELCTRQMGEWQRRAKILPLPRPDRKKSCRLGIVTAFLFEHSVWNAIVQGWIEHFDRGRVELHVFYLGNTGDLETVRARQAADVFHSGRTSLAGWADRICKSALDVLIFPEIGMDTFSLRLACLRLAPVQATTWGHPQTSGLPTMDYFLSAEAFEPGGAESHYTETLVRLPNLGCSFPGSGPSVETPDLAALGINADQPIIVCAGTPFKYAPRHDRLLVELARRIDNSQLLFFWASRYSRMADRLHARLADAFTQGGVDYSARVRRLPYLSRPRFLGLLQASTVFLDTIGFSGFNTAMAAVECGLPIVTREGRFMRGRFGSGILQHMDMGDLVAHSDREYVDLAIKLVSEPEYRREVSERMLSSRDILFDDVAPIRALEKHLLQWSGCDTAAAQD